MIELYSGTPGAGKSLHTASVIKAWLRMGRPVICNFEINTDLVKHPEQFYYVPNNKLNAQFLINFAAKYWTLTKKHVREDHILLVVDEAQLLYNARQWQQTDQNGWISFYTQHRKFGFKVILVAQFDRMLDRQIRSLIEYEYIHRKLSNFGIYGAVMTLFGLLNLFVSVKVWYPLKERLGADWFISRPGLYRLYDTYKQLDKT